MAFQVYTHIIESMSTATESRLKRAELIARVGQADCKSIVVNTLRGKFCKHYDNKAEFLELLATLADGLIIVELYVTPSAFESTLINARDSRAWMTDGQVLGDIAKLMLDMYRLKIDADYRAALDSFDHFQTVDYATVIATLMLGGRHILDSMLIMRSLIVRLQK